MDNKRITDSQLLEGIIRHLDDTQVAMLLEELEEEPALKEAFKTRLERADQTREAISPEEILKEGIKSSGGQEKVFFTELLRFVDRANLKDSEVYGRVNMDRKLWYRLRDHEDARTSKKNVLKMCIILRLDYWETYYLMSLAGFAFRPYSDVDKTDYIIGLCVRSGEYDPERVEALLEKVGEEPLGFGF